MLSWALAGCTLLSGTTVETPAQAVYLAQAELNMLLKVVVVYVEQPECTNVIVVACAEPIVKARLKVLAAEAGTAVNLAKRALAQGALIGDDRFTSAATSVRALITFVIARQLVN